MSVAHPQPNIPFEPAVLLWDDNPANSDLLGFETITAPVGAALLREHLDPVCVGVFGRWGCGKTTILKLLQKGFELGETGTIVVYTQPWAYDPSTDPKSTLIAEVLTHIRLCIEARSSMSEALRSKFKSLAKRVRLAKVLKLTARTALTAQLPSIADLERLFGEGEEIAEPTLEGFRSEFAGLLGHEELVDIRRVVVLVDDLDRCLPNTVVDILEAVKLFLSVEKMAFVIAADPEPVTQAIASKYEDSRGGPKLAERYLDKIVQIPVAVPALGLREVEAYIAQLLCSNYVGASHDSTVNLIRHCSDARLRGASHLLEGFSTDLDSVRNALGLSSQLAPILYEELEGNPRRIKRFLNAFWVRSQIAAGRGVSFETSAFAKLMVLEQLFGQDFQTLLDWLSEGDLAVNLTQLEAGEGEHTAQLRRWAKLDPPLAGVSLDPYLVLAAALSGRTLRHDSLPPHLRKVAADLSSNRAAERKRGQLAGAKLPSSDRTILAVELAEAIVRRPGNQKDLAESLMAVIGGADEVAASAASVLRRIPHRDIGPALVITLHPPGNTRLPLERLLDEWQEAGDLPEDSSRAVKLALGES